MGTIIIIFLTVATIMTWLLLITGAIAIVREIKNGKKNYERYKREYYEKHKEE